MTTHPPHELTWQEFWKDSCADENGNLNLDQIKRTLHEYKFLLDNVPIVYEQVTNGKISSPTCDPKFVIDCVQERVRLAFKDGCEYSHFKK